MDRIKQRRQQLGIRQVDLAKAINVSQSTMSDYETGRTEPDLDTLLEIAKNLQVSVSWLLREKTEHIINDRDHKRLLELCAENRLDTNLIDFVIQHQIVPSTSKRIPVLGNVAAGIPLDAIEDIVDYEEIDSAMAATGEFFGLRIKGASMEPRMRDGDVIIVRKQDTADTGDTIVALVNGDSATVKKLKIGPDGISLIPTNPAYDVQFYSAADVEKLPVRVIGKVVELRAKY